MEDGQADMALFECCEGGCVAEKQSKLQIVERQVEDVVVLTLAGEITLDDGELKFGRWVDGLLKKGHKKILLDLAGVTYIDSAGVGMMAAEYKIVRGNGGALKLLSLTGHSHRLLAMMKLMTVFEVFDDEATALRSFARM
jgi:anti-sigma B factor antagonist